MPENEALTWVAILAAVAAGGSCLAAIGSALIARTHGKLARTIAEKEWKREHKEAYPSPVLRSAAIVGGGKDPLRLRITLRSPIDRPIDVYGANVKGNYRGFETYPCPHEIPGLKVKDVEIPVEPVAADGPCAVRVYYLSGDSYGKRTFKPVALA